jgi:hypothetical protein
VTRRRWRWRGPGGAINPRAKNGRRIGPERSGAKNPARRPETSRGDQTETTGDEIEDDDNL